MACGGGVAWGRAGVRQGGPRSRVASTQAKTSQAAAWHLLERSFGMEQGPAQCGNELPDQRPQPPPALPHMTHLDCLQRLGGGKALRWHGGAVAGAMRGRAAVASSRRATAKNPTSAQNLRIRNLARSWLLAWSATLAGGGRKTCGAVAERRGTEGPGQAPLTGFSYGNLSGAREAHERREGVGGEFTRKTVSSEINSG